MTRDELVRYLDERSEPVPESGCRVWMGSMKGSGHGTIPWRGSTTTVHRVAYMLAHGELPKNVLVCHACDVACCINVDHLFAGSYRDNALDAIAKGRMAWQSRRPRGPKQTRGGIYYRDRPARRAALRLQLTALIERAAESERAELLGVRRRRNEYEWQRVIDYYTTTEDK